MKGKRMKENMEEESYCTVGEWIKIIEDDLHFSQEELMDHINQHQIIKEGLSPFYVTYISQYRERLIQKLMSYCTFILDLLKQGVDQCQEFLNSAMILCDPMGNLRRNDAHRISLGIQSTLQALWDLERCYRNENQGMKVMQMTGGMLPTAALLYDGNTTELNIGCIPVSKKQKLRKQNQEVKRCIQNSKKISLIRDKMPSCRN